MLNGDGNENGIKINRSNYTFFARLQCRFVRLKRHTSQLYNIFMEELSHMLTKDFVSCVHVRCYSFTAASISHFLTAAMKSVSCFSFNKIRLPSSFSVIHVSVNIKNNVEKDTTLLFFSL